MLYVITRTEGSFCARHGYISKQVNRTIAVGLKTTLRNSIDL